MIRINTLEADSEILITMLGAFAQAESESMSANIVWGKRQAMRDGKVTLQYRRLYGYRKGVDGNPEIIPEQAEIVRRIYDQYLAGASLRQIKTSLEADNIPQPEYSAEWTLDVIRGILTSEKYHNDALMQKTFIKDCISKKVVRNNGQLPMYLAQNNHPAIIDRHIHDAVQAEMARRNAGRSPSKKNASTGRTSYANRYALSERLVCGECGTLYRRCVWAKRGKRRVVWRCVSRLDYGTKYCHNSPTLVEEPLQRAILAAINEVMGNREDMIDEITGAMELELAPIPGQALSLSDIQRKIGELEGQFNTLLEEAAEQLGSQDYMEQFQKITNRPVREPLKGMLKVKNTANKGGPQTELFTLISIAGGQDTKTLDVPVNMLNINSAFRNESVRFLLFGRKRMVFRRFGRDCAVGMKSCHTLVTFIRQNFCFW